MVRARAPASCLLFIDIVVVACSYGCKASGTYVLTHALLRCRTVRWLACRAAARPTNGHPPRPARVYRHRHPGGHTLHTSKQADKASQAGESSSTQLAGVPTRTLSVAGACCATWPRLLTPPATCWSSSAWLRTWTPPSTRRPPANARASC